MGDCMKRCMLCTNPPVCFVNYSKHHALCVEHMEGNFRSIQCIWCKSQVRFITKSLLDCIHCNTIPADHVLNCNHLLCNKCFNMQPICIICSPQCQICKQSPTIKIPNCNHYFCNKCIEEKNTCEICIPKLCKKCNKLPRKADSYYCCFCFGKCSDCSLHPTIINTLSCKHGICAKCLKNLKKCAVCQEHICNKCAKASIKMRNCKHSLCTNCCYAFWKTECPECKPRDSYKCDICGHIGIIKKCSNDLHRFCLKCDSHICQLCTFPCCTCSLTFQGALLSQITCGHLSCGTCILSNPLLCKLCPKPEVVCKVCRKLYIRREDSKTSIKCTGCKTKICFQCGGALSWLGSHKCEFNIPI